MIDYDIDGLVQDCSNSIANALELLQSCTKPLICFLCIPPATDAKQEYESAYVYTTTYTTADCCSYIP